MNSEDDTKDIFMMKGLFQRILLKNTASNPKPARKQRKTLIIGETSIK
jgi:hypothetical protein